MKKTESTSFREIKANRIQSHTQAYNIRNVIGGLLLGWNKILASSLNEPPTNNWSKKDHFIMRNIQEPESIAQWERLRWGLRWDPSTKKKGRKERKKNQTEINLGSVQRYYKKRETHTNGQLILPKKKLPSLKRKKPLEYSS
jgi:hypothetical protein